MATGTILLSPGAGTPPDNTSGNQAAGILRRQGTEANPKKHFLIARFYNAQISHLWWVFRMPFDYASGGTLKIHWHAAATAGNVKWQARVGAITPADADTPLEHAQAAAATATTAVNGTENNRLVESSIALTMDSAVAGDLIFLCLFRDPVDAADTVAADADVVFVNFEYET